MRLCHCASNLNIINAAHVAAGIHQLSDNDAGDTGANLKSQAAAENERFLSEVVLPLTVLHDLTHHAEHNRRQRRFTQRTNNGADQRQRNRCKTMSATC